MWGGEKEEERAEKDGKKNNRQKRIYITATFEVEFEGGLRQKQYAPGVTDCLEGGRISGNRINAAQRVLPDIDVA